jgi:GntR family transcriptional regulator
MSTDHPAGFFLSGGAGTGPAAGSDAVNRQSKMPLHEQLYEILRGNLQRGEWAVGEMIPTEPELIEKYGVSRITVRQALNRLVNEGLIYRQQGRGTFVAEPTLEQGLTRIISFTEDMRQRGLAPGTRILFAGLLPAPEDVAEHLQIEPGVELARLERLRLANQKPMSIEESYLVHRYCPGLLQYDYSQVPLREILERQYDIRIVRARQVIRAAIATPHQSTLLGISQPSPLLFLERVSYSQHNLPVEFLRIYYRGDRYSLYNELHD